MRASEFAWSATEAWKDDLRESAAQIWCSISEPRVLSDKARFDDLRKMFPKAHLLGCSTGGQIHRGDVVDDTIAGIAIQFEATKLKLVCEPVADAGMSYNCGAAIGRRSRPTILLAYSFCPTD